MNKLFLLFLCVFFNFNVFATQNIEFVVSASPGGPNDTVTRKIADRIEKNSNLQFTIINKPGAAHVIAYNHVMTTTKPTLIMETPEIEKHEVFSQVDELYNGGHFMNILFVSEKSGIKNMKQMIELSDKRTINFGHGGVGSYSHLAMQSVCKTTLRCLDVPYKSAAEGMMGLLNGSIDAYAIVSYGSKQFLENDKYLAIHDIRLGKEKSWYKLFGKNLTEKDKRIIVDILKNTDAKFFTDMGLER